jgi:hypothetical protein
VTKERRNDVLALTLLTAIISLVFSDVLLGWNSLYLRDVAQYYYPAKHVLREIVLGGELPQWNPFFSGGQPLAANPEHEVFYPLTWLILLPDFDFGFHLLIVLHLLLAAWTMYALLRSIGAGPPAAFVAGLSFALGGLLLSCITLLPCLFVLAWLPLTCLFTRRYLRDGRKQDFALAALSLGMQVLVGEPTMVLQTGLLLGFYALSVRRVRRLGLVVLAACCVGAAMLIPAADHARDSVRALGFDFAIVTNWSMPFLRVAELVYPNVFGHNLVGGEQVYWGRNLYPGHGLPFLMSIYAGLLIVTLAAAGLAIRARGAILFASITVVSTVLALGGHTPVWRWLYELGVVRSIRYPEKFIAMGVFAMIVFAGRVLDEVLRGDERARRATLRVTIAVAATAAAVFVLTLTPASTAIFKTIWRAHSDPPVQMLALWRSAWLVGFLRAMLLALLLRNLPMMRRSRWLAVAALFVLLDLGLLIPEIAPRISSEYFREAPEIARMLPDAGGRLLHLADWDRDDPRFRRYQLPQPEQYWIRRNAMLPMIPAQWNARMVLESDYDFTALQCTPQFTAAARTLAAARPDWLDVIAPMANATHVAVFNDPGEAYGHAHDEPREVQPVRIVPIGSHPRYFFAKAIATLHGASFPPDATPGTAFISAPAFVPAFGVVRGVRESANRVTIDAETTGRAFLVISVTPHKYWNVTIDGARAETVPTNIGFQGVAIPIAGRHTIRMRYHNPLLIPGAAITAVTVMLLAYVAITMRGL